MQSMFRLPWSTESPGDKIMEKATLHKSRPLPVVDVPAFMTKLKRKRSDSPEPASPQPAHVTKKWKTAQGEVKPSVTESGSSERMPVVDGIVTETPRPADAPLDVPKTASAEVLESRPKAHPPKKEETASKSKAKPQKSAVKPEPALPSNPTSTMASPLNAVQQVIEAQFDYEILLKHNELRLIEQELAKCQVSLEQLRRCALIPFPGTEGLSEAVSGGIGPALQPPSGNTLPRHAAPWGVTDGPYTRHYAKWLINDGQFDSMSERELAAQSHGYFGQGEGRTTRGSHADFGSTSKARTSRTSTGTLKLPALGENPAPAPKIDPLLHKRSTDGQWVRLYCAQCGHSNFSNTQGFLNHCRIKHNQVFKSHDQAAIACGIPVDVNEVGNPVSATEPAGTPATTPAITFPAPTPTTPGIVHPLIRSDPAEPAKDVYRNFNKTPREQVKPSAPVSNPNFTPSPGLPRLNLLLKQSGFDGNFKQIVETARAKVDLDSMETSDDDLADSVVQTPISAKPQQLVRFPIGVPHGASASKAPAGRPGSKKGHSNVHARFPMTFPPPVNVNHGNGHRLPDSPVDLSPNTVESNPGLVSDHDDDDDEEMDDARSQPDIVMNDDVVVEDSSDVEGAVERAGSRKGLGGCFDKGEGSRKH